MSKYIRHDIVEAVQFTGENYDQINDLCPDDSFSSHGKVYVYLDEGSVRLKIGDWLVYDIEDRVFYIVGGDDFKKNYTRVLTEKE